MKQYRVLYAGDLWPRMRCSIRGHHWFGDEDEDGRYCTRCWRVEERPLALRVFRKKSSLIEGRG